MNNKIDTAPVRTELRNKRKKPRGVQWVLASCTSYAKTHCTIARHVWRQPSNQPQTEVRPRAINQNIEL